MLLNDSHAPLRRVLLLKLNKQRALSIGWAAQLFETDCAGLRKVVAERFQECADYVIYANHGQLISFGRALHLWRMSTPLSMPALADLVTYQNSLN